MCTHRHQRGQSPGSTFFKPDVDGCICCNKCATLGRNRDKIPHALAKAFESGNFHSYGEIYFIHLPTELVFKFNGRRLQLEGRRTQDGRGYAQGGISPIQPGDRKQAVELGLID